MKIQTPKKIIEDLIDAGCSQETIAKNCGLTQPSVSRILSGSDPKSSVLIRLVEYSKRAAVKANDAEVSSEH